MFRKISPLLYMCLLNCFFVSIIDLYMCRCFCHEKCHLMKKHTLNPCSSDLGKVRMEKTSTYYAGLKLICSFLCQICLDPWRIFEQKETKIQQGDSPFNAVKLVLLLHSVTKNLKVAFVKIF